MRRNEIELTHPVDTNRVLDIARSVATDQNYRWVVTGPNSARAYQDSKAAHTSSMTLVFGVELRDSQLVLRRETTGGLSVAIGLGPLGPSKVNREFEAITCGVRSALRTAGMAR